MKDSRIVLIASVIGVVLGVAIISGGTYAFFKAQGGESSEADVSGKVNTVDEFNFQIDGSLSLNANPESLPENGSNLVNTVNAKARLKANDSGEDTSYNYYVYLRVNNNNFVHTKEDTPEVVLKVVKPDGTEVTNISGLTYDASLGFDMTEVAPGTYLVASDVITSNDSTKFLEENWTITLTYLNLNFDQSGNYGHSMGVDVLLKKEAIGG